MLLEDLTDIEINLKNLLSYDIKNNLGLIGTKELLMKYLNYLYKGKRYLIDNYSQYLYRVRANIDKNGNPIDFFYHSDELLAPPKKDATKGRCNNWREPILYCSNHPITCIAEIPNLKVGCYYTLITFKLDELKKISPVSFIGVEILRKNDNLLSKFLSDFYKDLKNDPNFDKISKIDLALSKEFQIRLPENDWENKSTYNSTIAWRQLCFEHSQSNCLIYPSAASLLKTANYAFEPEYAKSIMIPIEVNRFKVNQVEDNGLKFVVEIDYTAILNGYGEIEWKPKFPIIEEALTHERLEDNPFLLIG